MEAARPTPLLVGGLPLTKRRTKISDSKLLEMFGGKEREASAAHTSTVSTQSTLAGEHFHLNQLILERGPTTTLTTEHAKDRYLLRQSSEHRIVDLWIEEQYQRGRLFVIHRDGLDLLWKAFLSTVPRNRTLHHFPTGSKEGERPGSANAGGSMFGDEEMLLGSSASRIMTSPGYSEDGGAAQLENRRLTYKVQQLEKLLNRRISGNSISSSAAVVRKRRTASILGTHNYARSLMTTAATMELLQDDEDRCRSLVQELENAATQALMGQHKASWFGLQNRTTKRNLVATPYNSYRPKIPTEHSLAGEEYLRRWLMGETFQHYEDVLTMIQHHENDVRHGIEMEEESSWRPMWRSFVEPHYAKLSVAQATEIVNLNTIQRKLRHDSGNAGAAAKLEMMDDMEAYGRRMILAFAFEGQVSNSEVLGQLESVRSLEVKIGTLAKELQRQRWRHRGEVQSLKAQLPHDGLYRKAVGGIAPYTPHCSLALAKGIGINQRPISPGGAPNVPVGPSFSTRYIRQQHSHDTVKEAELAKKRHAEALSLVKQIDETDDWWAGF